MNQRCTVTIGMVLILVFSVLSLPPSVNGLDENVTWENMNPTIAPLARRSAGLVYDSESDLVILFSGRDPSLPTYLRYGDTWTYDVDTNTWENVTPEDGPPPRGTHAKFDYDTESDRAVFFGGTKPGEPFAAYGDTWAYDCNSNTWENRTPAVSPRPSTAHGWAYDIESDRFILYGGMWSDPTAPGWRGTQKMTWAYDYNSNTWTNMSPATNPDLIYTCPMVYDSESDRIILFGGKFRNTTFEEQRDETWAYDFNTNTWTNMNPPVAPPRRNRHSLTYHAGWDRIVLFGGDKDNPSVYYSDTWLYDYNTNNWTELSVDTHPSSRIYGDLTYDEGSEKVVLFGGINSMGVTFGDTWILPGTHITTTLTTTPTPTTGNGEWPPPIWVYLVVAGAGVVIIVLVVFMRRR